MRRVVALGCSISLEQILGMACDALGICGCKSRGRRTFVRALTFMGLGARNELRVVLAEFVVFTDEVFGLDWLFSNVEMRP